MTSNPIETERKIRQLDNDVQSIYEMLSAIQGTQTRHGNRLQELAEKVDGLDGRLGGVETRLDAVETRLGGVETRLGGVETGLNGAETRLGGLDAKLDTVLELLRGGSQGR